MTARYSVAIIGAGPTGLVLANLLGKAGIATLLVEANPATVGEPRAVSIDDESLRVVQDMGLRDVVYSEIVSGYGSEYFGPDGSLFLKVKPQAEPYGHPRRNAFRQPVFEAQLREGLGRYPNVETRFETRCEGFVERNDHISITLKNGAGEQEQVTAEYMVGCDGAWSSTREALGFTLVGSSLGERWLILDLEDSPVTSSETIVYCDPKRPGIALPGPRLTRRYEFKLMPGETDELMTSDAQVEQLLKTHDAAPGSKVVRKAIYHFHARIADHWGRGRIWLAGDAAHLMPPFAGQGMNGGIRDAANLAWKLAAVIQHRIGPGLLASYEKERRTHIASMIKLALRMGGIFAPRTALHGLAIRAAFRLLSFWPAAKEYLAEMKYKPAPRFDCGFLLEAQLSSSGIVGRMLPQPPLPAGYGAASLDELLGGGFALVGFDVDHARLEALVLGACWDKLIERRISLSTRKLTEFARHQGKLLLIRPDHYVMARFSPKEAPQVACRLEQLLNMSWEAPDATSLTSGPGVRTATAGSGTSSSTAAQGNAGALHG